MAAVAYGVTVMDYDTTSKELVFPVDGEVIDVSRWRGAHADHTVESSGGRGRIG